MNCPICHEKNVSAGHILGHSAKGVPKTLSQAERDRKADRLAIVRLKRWPAEKRKEGLLKKWMSKGKAAHV